MVKLLQILFLGLLPNLLFGQWEYSFRIINTSDGLPSNTIYDIYQATDGSILIGHEKGLSRYNGVSFLNYESDKVMPLSNIVELAPDKYLCRSFNDDCYITDANQLIKQIQLSKKGAGFSEYVKLNDNSVIKINKNAIEKVWDGKKLLTQPSKLIELDSLRIYSAAILGNKLLLNAASKFLIYDLKNFQLENSLNKDIGPRTVCMHFNNEFLILSSTTGKAWNISKTGVATERTLTGYNPNDKFACHALIQDSILAIGTFGGLYLYNKNYELITKLFVKKQLTCIQEDKEHNLWIGTQLEGILVVPSIQIKQIHQDFFQENKFSISNLIIIQDTLLVAGSYDGRLAFFGADGKLKKLINLGGKSEVQALCYNETKNTLYADCLNLYEIDLDNYQIKSSHKSRSVKDLQIRNDTLFMATSYGLHVGQNAENYIIYNDSLWCKKVVPFGKGFLVESLDGLCLMDNNQLTLLHEDFIGGDENKILVVQALNYSAGRTIFAHEGKVFEVVGLNTIQLFELEDVQIKSIVASATSVWVSDGTKIVQFNAEGKKEINTSKGLLVNDIIKLVLFQNKLLVVGAQKIQLFEENLKVNTLKPSLNVLNVRGSFELQKEILYSAFKENFLEIKLEILPNISSLGKDKIFYRITGIVPNWTPILNETLLLERLPYGKQQLEIMGYNEDGVSSDIVVLNLKIYPPYYATWWFRFLTLFTLVGIIFFIVKWRTRVIEKKNALALQTAQMQAKAIQSELKALRSQINPHFIFNSLSAIHSKILNGESRSAYDHLSRFSSLLRKSLKYTSQELLSVEEELSFLQDYISLEQSRSEDSFEFELVNDDNLDLSQLSFPSLLSQPFVENAIRHGLAHSQGVKLLKLQIEGTPQQFDFIIEDNGVGRKQADEINAIRNKSHESFSTKAMEERIEMINASGHLHVLLTILDLPKGTRVIIRIKTTL